MSLWVTLSSREYCGMFAVGRNTGAEEYMLHGRKGSQTPISAILAHSAAAKSANISECFVDEKVEFDPDRLVELVVAHGEAGAQALIDDTLREIATLTAELVHNFNQRSHPKNGQVATLCRKIENASRTVGLTGYLKVLDDFRDCHKRYDENARSAVLHRLVRLGASALRQGWGICDRWA